MAKELIVNYDNKPCYSIYIDNSYDAFCDKVNEISNFKKSKICIVTDSNVANIYLNDMVEFAKNAFEQVFTFIIPAGEANKNLSQIEKLYEYLINNHFDRTDSLIALGGGVVGDMTGYTAATYLIICDFYVSVSFLLYFIRNLAKRFQSRIYPFKCC